MSTDPETVAGEVAGRALDRQRDGTYPPGIDDALTADVDARIREASTHTTALRAAVAQVRALGPFEIPRYRGTSRVRSAYDRMIRAAVGYALADLVRQLESYRTAIDRVLDAVVDEVGEADEVEAGPGDG